MGDIPSTDNLAEALQAAGRTHHEYEQSVLGGVRDEQWAGWYAAYLLGRLGDFTEPSFLTRWLQDAPTGADWSASAAGYVVEQLGS